jgi:hypothetical protein
MPLLKRSLAWKVYFYFFSFVNIPSN